MPTTSGIGSFLRPSGGPSFAGSAFTTSVTRTPSLLIAHGAHPKYIQAQLGHASIQTTLDRYGHLMPQLHQAEAWKLGQLVFGQEAAPAARRLQAVRVGRPPRGSEAGAETRKG